jgi:hypothetical protein
VRKRPELLLAVSVDSLLAVLTTQCNLAGESSKCCQVLEALADVVQNQRRFLAIQQWLGTKFPCLSAEMTRNEVK